MRANHLRQLALLLQDGPVDRVHEMNVRNNESQRLARFPQQTQTDSEKCNRRRRILWIHFPGDNRRRMGPRPCDVAA